MADADSSLARASFEPACKKVLYSISKKYMFETGLETFLNDSAEMIYCTFFGDIVLTKGTRFNVFVYPLTR